MKPKHTPGPWEIKAWPKNADLTIVSGLTDGLYTKSIADLPDSWYDSRENKESNAALIAAAPDLLEWLEQAVEHTEALELENIPGWFDSAKAAIAKARGEG